MKIINFIFKVLKSLKDKAIYFEALQATRENKDIAIFVKFMFDQAQKYFELEIQKMSQGNDESNDSKGGFKFIF